MLSSSLAFMSLLSDEVVMKQNTGGMHPEYGVEWGGLERMPKRKTASQREEH